MINQEKTDYNPLLLGPLIHQTGILLFSAMKINLFMFLVYLGPMIFFWGIFKNRSSFNYLKQPFIYHILLIISLSMWIRFEAGGANGGTFQDANGSSAMFYFLILGCNPYSLQMPTVKKYFLISGCIGVIAAILFRNQIYSLQAWANGFGENMEGVTLAMALIYVLSTAGFFLLIPKFISKYIEFFSLFLILLAIVAGMAAGRRGYSAFLLLFVVEYIIITMIRSKGTVVGRFIFVIALIAFIYWFYLTQKDGILYTFFYRLDVDSRWFVFEMWEREMAKDWSWWIWGKGVSGGYWDGYFNEYRPGIENGIRHMILKGGILYLGSYVILAIMAIYKAIFQSKNSFMKGLGIYVLNLTGFLYVWGTPSITYLHLFLWISYSWIFCTPLRKMNDEQITKALGLQKS